MKLLYLFILLTPGVLFGQYLEGTWHLIKYPGAMPVAGEVSFVFTPDTLFSRMTTLDMATEDSVLPRVVNNVESMKIVAQRKSRTGDTVTYIVREKKSEAASYISFRFVRETSDRLKLSVGEKAGRAKKPRYPADSEYVSFGSLVDSVKYAELTALPDPATITKEHVIFILKDLRATLANMEAAHDFKRKMKEAWGFSIIFELSDRIMMDLEALGYSPVKWSKGPEEIVEMHRGDPEVAQLMEDLRQITDRW